MDDLIGFELNEKYKHLQSVGLFVSNAIVQERKNAVEFCSAAMYGSSFQCFCSLCVCFFLYETAETLVPSGELHNYKPFEVIEFFFMDIGYMHLKYDHAKCKLRS